MSFIADKQTLEDLNAAGRHKSNSIYRLFDQSITSGGRQLLDEMFRNPLIDADMINERVLAFRWFGSQQLQLNFSGESFNIMENYLRSQSGHLFESWWNITLMENTE